MSEFDSGSDNPGESRMSEFDPGRGNGFVRDVMRRINPVGTRDEGWTRLPSVGT